MHDKPVLDGGFGESLQGLLNAEWHHVCSLPLLEWQTSAFNRAKHHVSVSGVQTNYCKFNHQVLHKSDVSLTVNEGMDIRGFIKSMKESGLLDGHFTKAILISMRSKSET